MESFRPTLAGGAKQKKKTGAKNERGPGGHLKYNFSFTVAVAVASVLDNKYG